MAQARHRVQRIPLGLEGDNFEVVSIDVPPTTSRAGHQSALSLSLSQCRAAGSYRRPGHQASSPHSMSGGGGFFAGSQGANDSPGGGKNKNQTLRPVVVQQLLEAYQPHPDADFQIDGQDISQVSFIARIMTVNKGATNVSYSVEDGTGQIDVRQWLETADDDSGSLEGIEQDKYVRIVGVLKIFSNKRHVGATIVHPLEALDGSRDYNEMQYHLLEVIHTHLIAKKGPTGMSSYGAPAARNAGIGDPYSRANGHSDAGDQYSDLPPIQRKIMQYFSRMGSSDNLPPEGVDISAVARGVRESEEAVRDQVENLIGDGHLYTTIDEAHILPTS